jgi:predicted short-subunit dehydrogenase-like oxidoreductase (DUF2520 family)
MAAGRPARLAVGVVSAGRVGAVLGAALAAAGHHVVATSGVSRESARRAEALLPGVPREAPDDVVAEADLVLLAVPDDTLPGLVRGLAAAGAFRTGQIVVHTSGAHGVGLLAPAVERGVLPLALHPVMTFTGRPEDVARLAGASVGVTAGDGDEAAWSVGEALVVEMGAEPVRVAEQLRPLYHAALAHGANHLVTLVRDCVQLLDGAGIGPPSGSSRRCCRPRWTTRCATATARSPGRSRGATPAPSPSTCASSPPPTPTSPAPTGARRPHGPPRAGGRTAARPRRAGRPARASRRNVTAARTRGGFVPGQLTVHHDPRALHVVTRALKGAGAASRSSRRWARCTTGTAS